MVLTFHPPLVSSACRLLDALLAAAPDALARLHLTGAPYFLLAYPGSDLREPARLLHRWRGRGCGGGVEGAGGYVWVGGWVGGWVGAGGRRWLQCGWLGGARHSNVKVSQCQP